MARLRACSSVCRASCHDAKGFRLDMTDEMLALSSTRLTRIEVLIGHCSYLPFSQAGPSGRHCETSATFGGQNLDPSGDKYKGAERDGFHLRYVRTI